MIPALIIAGAVISFLYGIVVGSFLNVCIYRLPLGESLIKPPSHCPTCNTRLRNKDLFPLFSYLFLRGRCRYCKTRISPRYFTIELITGVLFLAVFFALQMPGRFADYLLASTNWWLLVVVMWFFVSAMLVTFMIDLDTTLVIEPVTWVAAAAGLVAEIITHQLNGTPYPFHLGPVPIPAAIPGMVIGFGFFLAMDWFGRLLFRKPSMGLGDSFIGAAIGAMLGVKLALFSFAIAVVFGAVIGVMLMIFGALKRTPAPGSEPARKDDPQAQPEGLYMPFGPFLAASAVLVMLLPDWLFNHTARLWDAWIHLFG